ncbi:hypothetical protein V1512DRAFT_280389, partial [Lipomyces arxii]|uniref:uncharacterized protein n=1 Tax=Lipomyces arxii TaxID=56418 RepID=UPI0034CE4CC0
QSVLSYFQNGSFPEENDANLVVSDKATVASVVDVLDDEIAKIKKEIEDTCNQNASELNSYMRLSQSLYDGIKQSEKQVAEIKAMSESHENADGTIYNLSDEYDALFSSHSRNRSYIDAMNQIWFIKATLIELRSCFESGLFVQCVPLLKSAETKITSFPDWQKITVLSILKEEVNLLDSKIFHTLDNLWKNFIHFNETDQELTVYASLDEPEYRDVTLEDVADALQRYDLPGKLKSLNTQLKDSILSHLLNLSSLAMVDISDNENSSTLGIISSNDTSKRSVEYLLANLSKFITFVNSSFPKQVSHSIAVDLVSVITLQLIDCNLEQSLPLSLSEFHMFESVLQKVKEFDDFLSAQQWSKDAELTDWVRRVPSVWYKKKCDTILIYTRSVVSEAATSDRKMVEKHSVSVSAQALEGAGRSESWSNDDGQRSSNEYDWNDEWDDDNTNANQNAVADDLAPADDEQAADDDGWGFDESLDLDGGDAANENGDGSDPDDWNWDDEDETAKPVVMPVAPVAKKIKPLISKSSPSRGSSRINPVAAEAFVPGLGESYVVTEVPQKILTLIQTLLQESTELGTKYKKLSIAPASKNLKSLISYVLGAFRALAPLHYGDSFDSNLFLSNDCTYLSEQISSMKDLGADAYLLMEMANKLNNSNDAAF